MGIKPNSWRLASRLAAQRHWGYLRPIMSAQAPIPIALTIAGSDSSGGAGIQADLKSFAACGAYGASVITALTAQNTRGVRAVHPVPAVFVAAQLDAVFDDLDVTAVKIGMIADRDIIAAVAASLLARRPAHVVLDPVMVATSGDSLLAPDAVDALRRKLLPLADLITPNMPEAAALLDQAVAESEEEMAEQGRQMLAFGCRAVLVKGGHGSGPESVDLLVTADAVRRFASPRIETVNTHGTGCSLSAAIAAFLARGDDLGTAIERGKRFVSRAIETSHRLSVGHGHGPIHHFHALD
jgi:hydroxymethylpyrimidine/phosphomethylpyrimidine kinase